MRKICLKKCSNKKIRKTLIIAMGMVLFGAPAWAQVGIGTNTPDASAILDLTSTTKGLLISRVTLVQRNAIALPATGLMVFQIDNTPGYYYNAGTPGVPNWVTIFSGSSAGGWDLSGNSGTTVGTHFLGTTDAEDFAIYTGNAEKLRITSAGNVGIGTISPGNKLHVEKARSNTISSAQAAYKLGGNDVYLFGGSLLSTPFSVWMQAFRPSDEATFPLVLNPNGGNVGIGTTAPASNLHVAGSQRQIRISDNEDPTGLWTIGTSTAVDNTSLVIEDDAANPRMTISEIGNVGIGTTSPGAKLHLSGKGYIATDTLFLIQNDKDATPDSVLMMTKGGNVGIGTTAPSQILHIYGNTDGEMITLSENANAGANASSLFEVKNDNGNAGTYGIFSTVHSLTHLANKVFINSRGSASGLVVSASGGEIEFYTSSLSTAANERMRITSIGNVGIGTTSPGAKLEVAGQVKITGGTPGAGKVLTSDAVGLATWNTPTNGDITGVIAGTGLTGGGTTGSVTVNAVGDNGLTTNANDIDFGGTLNQ
ncbi:MAG: hypothetical protein JKX73_07955, partial [Flavobacteriales bacterium]|nr:hypothetical protein [Flavobacteriales bacterium]